MIEIQEKLTQIGNKISNYNKKENRKYIIGLGIVCGKDINKTNFNIDKFKMPNLNIAIMTQDTLDKSYISLGLKPINSNKGLEYFLNNKTKEQAIKDGFKIEIFHLDETNKLEEFIHKNIV